MHPLSSFLCILCILFPYTLHPTPYTLHPLKPRSESPSLKYARGAEKPDGELRGQLNQWDIDTQLGAFPV